MKRIPKPLLCLLGAILFLVLCLLVTQQLLPHQVFLPASPLNDEVLYNRQVAGVLQGGVPRGVFGYDESRADIGHFATWGPLIIYLYALPGLLAGGGVNLMFWGNVFFALAGWMVFVAATRIDGRRQLLFGAVLFLLATPLTYVFSGSAETFHYALLLAVTGLCCACLRQERPALYGALLALCLLGSLIRPYELAFWLYPLVAALRHKNKWCVLLCFAGGLVSLPASLFCLSKLSAPYFAGGMNFDALLSLAKGDTAPLAAQLSDYLTKLFAMMQSEVGGNFWLLLLLFVLTLAAFCRDLWCRRPAPLKGCALVVSLAVCLALLLLYQPDQSRRHVLLLCIGLLAALLLENPRWLVGAAPAFAVLFVVAGYPASFGTVPRYDAALDAEMTVLSNALEESQAAVSSDDAWDATLAYSTYDRIFHGYLYAVPPGMGIQFDRCEFLADAEEPLHSRYVMTVADSNCVPRLVADGWQLLVETEHCVIYERGA